MAILDGGLERWQADGRPTESGTNSHPAATFDESSLVDNVAAKVEKEQVLALVRTLESGGAEVSTPVLLDTLPTSSFEGTGPVAVGRRGVRLETAKIRAKRRILHPVASVRSLGYCVRVGPHHWRGLATIRNVVRCRHRLLPQSTGHHSGICSGWCYRRHTSAVL